MKKLIKVTSILGAVVMGVSATGVGVVNAAKITDNVSGDTTATVGLTKDPNAKVTLTNAPVFNFGSQEIGAQPLDLQAQTVDEALTVVNPGVLDGWDVTLKGTDFIDSKDSTLKLKGAVLTLKGVVSSKDEGNESSAPTTGSVTVNSDDTPIFTAAAGNGLGTWLNTYAEKTDAAKLAIPAGNQAGEYVSNLTWTLTNAPGSQAE